MKQLFATLARAPKRTAVFLALAAAVIVPAGLYAWGPDRPNVDAATGADHVVFNSMRENPNYGDERQFITVQDPATGDYGNDVTVEPGKEYMVRVLIHNDANPEAHPDKDLTAVNTTLKTIVPTKTGTSNAITAYVDADNAEQVYADVAFNSDEQFNLAYVAGSAVVYNNGYAAGDDGKPFSDSLVTSAGAKLGYEAEGDGKIPGCFQYINYVYFKVKPQFAATPDFAMEKKVSETGKNAWKDSLAATPGQTVDYRVEYKNTGEVQHDDVVIKDTLPTGMNYVAGSSKLYNSQNTQGKTLSDNIMTASGVNIGSHAAGANSFVVYQAKVAANDDLAECGANKLTNKATVVTDYGTKDDTAEVTVTKECEEEPPVEIEVCELDTKKVITIDEKDFDDTKHSKNLDDCKETPVTPPTEIEVCDLETKKIVTIKEDDFNESKHSKNLDDCKEAPKPPVTIDVCELDTNKVITIEEKDFDAEKHSTDLADCEETPVTPTPEEPTPEEPKTEKPVTELPMTGIANDILTFISAGSFVAALGYYIASRRLV